jgi:glutamine amidotransferase
VYFVHSFYVDAADRSLVTARATHGIAFDAAVGRDNLQAVQFHPEKSGAEGLAMLRRWLAAGGLA